MYKLYYLDQWKHTKTKRVSRRFYHYSYNLLEDKKQKHEDNKDFNTYISNAIDCKANNQINQCNNDNKYGNDTNEIEQFLEVF
ncbi:Mlp family lipoprotein (plasmid) [Borrelia puertoricensis]|uniref:Mlp family lipoprotein n=1 Tax=Borrelia puertoricensis TaxID=2756107 RepID=UPI001FF1D08C|nr:Mlp family lipoprotein [Borrelia puertoricensis]